MNLREPESVETDVVGGGQAGLSGGYHLAQRGVRFVILDANERIGDSWRKRWDSLRLFTPARFSGLSGMPFPAPAQSFPTKDEVADYLESYASHFERPVRTGVRVDGLSWNGDRFLVTSGRACKGSSTPGSWARRHPDGRPASVLPSFALLLTPYE